MGVAKQKGGLGFKDLEYFNKAMLAKEAWRLPYNPSSMAVQIMKEKYNRSSELLESKIWYGASHI